MTIKSKDLIHPRFDVHFQVESVGTPDRECHAKCGAVIDDPPSQLAVDLAFVTCSRCRVMDARAVIKRPTHHVTFGLGGNGFCAFCTCGWRSSDDMSRAVVVTASAAHKWRAFILTSHDVTCALDELRKAARRCSDDLGLSPDLAVSAIAFTTQFAIDFGRRDPVEMRALERALITLVAEGGEPVSAAEQENLTEVERQAEDYSAKSTRVSMSASEQENLTEVEQQAEDFAAEKLGRDAPAAARAVVRDGFLAGYLVGVLKFSGCVGAQLVDAGDRLMDEVERG